jgi:hypothetical protein
VEKRHELHHFKNQSRPRTLIHSMIRGKPMSAIYPNVYTNAPAQRFVPWLRQQFEELGWRSSRESDDDIRLQIEIGQWTRELSGFWFVSDELNELDGIPLANDWGFVALDAPGQVPASWAQSEFAGCILGSLFEIMLVEIIDRQTVLLMNTDTAFWGFIGDLNLGGLEDVLPEVERRYGEAVTNALDDALALRSDDFEDDEIEIYLKARYQPPAAPAKRAVVCELFLERRLLAKD